MQVLIVRRRGVGFLSVTPAGSTTLGQKSWGIAIANEVTMANLAGRRAAGICALGLSWVCVARAWAGAHQGDAAAVVAPAPPPLPGAQDQQAPPETRWTNWYGYQLVLADAAFVGLGLAVDHAEAWLPGYVGAPILVHALHHRVDLAIVSPVMRLVLPLLGAALGSQHRSCNANGDECAIGGAIWGGSIGAAVALLLDYGLAWERQAVPSGAVSRQRPEDRRRPPPTDLWTMTAGLVPRDNGLRFVVGATF